MAESEPVKVKMEDPISTLPQLSIPASAQGQAPAQSEAPPSAPAHAQPQDQASPTCLPKKLMHKNHLQEYTQRSSIHHPIYHTVNEGFQHAPKFRSTVMVDGLSYTSLNTYSNRKAAEQDVAKLALECIEKKVKDEGCPLIREDRVFCKSILNEFAVKMNLEKPAYHTVLQGGLVQLFISSLVFNGVSYTGEASKTKKEAEQLAARAVILSLLGESGSSTIMSEIIKSKFKLYAALRKAKDSPYAYGSEIISSKDKEVETSVVTDNVPTSATAQASSGMQPPHHEFKIPKMESSEPISLPIAFVPPILGQSSDVGPSAAKKRRKNKKKANKKLHTEAPLAIVAMPLTQAPPCSVAQ